MVRRWSLFLALAAFVITACAGQAPVPSTTRFASSPSATADSASGAPTQPEPSDPLKSFDVAVGGTTITGHCSGTRLGDEPAILLLHGLGSNQRELARLEASMEDKALVCAYDRPGANGASGQPVLGARTVNQVAAEARELLNVLQISPPFFLVGHSAGGTIAVVFAHQYPDDVAGFVVSNPMPPYSTLRELNEQHQPPEGMDALRASDYAGQNAEGIDFRSTDLMLEPLSDDLPFAVLFGEDRSCGGFLDYCNMVYDDWQAMQSALAATGEGGRFVFVENSGHAVLESQPEAYLDAVEEVWAEATR